MGVTSLSPEFITGVATSALVKGNFVMRTTTAPGYRKFGECGDGGVADGVAADNYDSGSGEAKIAVGKYVRANVNGTTDILIRDPLKVASGVGIKATANGDWVNAIALEGFTTNGVGEIEVMLVAPYRLSVPA